MYVLLSFLHISLSLSPLSLFIQNFRKSSSQHLVLLFLRFLLFLRRKEGQNTYAHLKSPDFFSKKHTVYIGQVIGLNLTNSTCSKSTLGVSLQVLRGVFPNPFKGSRVSWVYFLHNSIKFTIFCKLQISCHTFIK
jgi:hypothetical protein